VELTPAPAATETPDDQDLLIGGRLRDVRKASGLRLKQVAERAGLSVSLLSQIERGISSPSMRSLRSICHALGIDGEALFASPTPAQSPAADAPFVVRARDLQPVTVGGVSKYRVTPAACSGMEGFLMEIGPDAVSDPNFLLQTGDKIGFLVRGELRLFIDDVVIQLKAGDFYGFSSGHRYRWENGWEEATTLLVINSNHFYV
jgi:transcriptional regulator with XRE-family HTH domain